MSSRLISIAIALVLCATTFLTAQPVSAAAGVVSGLRLPFAVSGSDVFMAANTHTDGGKKDRHAVDFGKKAGSAYVEFPVLAMHDGKIQKSSKENEGVLILDHGDGYCSYYYHLNVDKIRIDEAGKKLEDGTSVKAGKQIATAGKTQASVIHLHTLVISKKGQAKCPGYNPDADEISMNFDGYGVMPKAGGMNNGKTIKAVQSQPQPQPQPAAAIWKNGQRITLRSANAPALALDIYGGKAIKDSKIVQWKAHGGRNQIWKVEAHSNGYYRLHADLDYSQCMVIQNASKSDGAKLILHTCSPSGQGNEWWKPTKAGNTISITSRLSGKVLDVPGATTKMGEQIILWSWNGGKNQKWITEYK